jgi:hypothetical protein
MAHGGRRKGAGRRPTVGSAGPVVIWVVRVPASLEKRVLKWAKTQPDKPGKSEAARRLWETALAAEGY